MKKPHLWVIEMKDGLRWIPTVGAMPTLTAARAELKIWRRHDTGSELRLNKYVPAKYHE